MLNRDTRHSGRIDPVQLARILENAAVHILVVGDSGGIGSLGSIGIIGVLCICLGRVALARDAPAAIPGESRLSAGMIPAAGLLDLTLSIAAKDLPFSAAARIGDDARHLLTLAVVAAELSRRAAPGAGTLTVDPLSVVGAIACPRRIAERAAWRAIDRRALAFAVARAAQAVYRE
jgi:hypothetical protein